MIEIKHPTLMFFLKNDKKINILFWYQLVVFYGRGGVRSLSSECLRLNNMHSMQ